MATHTHIEKWGAEDSGGARVAWRSTQGFSHKDFYKYATKVEYKIEWRTSLRATPGDLYVALAKSLNDANNDNYLWKSSTHQSYKDWKTFTTEIPVSSFLAADAGSAPWILLSFSATVIREWYVNYSQLTVTYAIPDITYTYKDWNGKILKKETLEKGTTPTPPPDPTKADDDKYSYTFAGWTIYDESTSNVTYVAEYDRHIHKYTITISTDGNGKITNRNGTEAVSHKVNYGSVPELTAVPNDGYRFLKWHDGNTENPRKFPAVTSDITIMALFEPTGETEFSAYLGTSSNKITGRLGTTEVQGYIGTTRVF